MVPIVAFLDKQGVEMQDLIMTVCRDGTESFWSIYASHGGPDELESRFRKSGAFSTLAGGHASTVAHCSCRTFSCTVSANINIVSRGRSACWMPEAGLVSTSHVQDQARSSMPIHNETKLIHTDIDRRRQRDMILVLTSVRRAP